MPAASTRTQVPSASAVNRQVRCPFAQCGNEILDERVQARPRAVLVRAASQAPGGPEEDTDGGFAHGGWSHAFFDEVVGGAGVASAASAAT